LGIKFLISIIPVTHYQFVCKKCKKEFDLSEKDINNTWNKFTESYHRKIALGEMEPIDTREGFDLERVSYMGICYEGYPAVMTVDYYKNLGIDITKLHEQRSY